METLQMVRAGSLGTATSSLGPRSPSRRDGQGVYRITLQDYWLLDSAPADPICPPEILKIYVHEHRDLCHLLFPKQ